MKGSGVARVHLFFSFEVDSEQFSCALVHHFAKSYKDPDPDNGVWIVEPDLDCNNYRVMSVVHVDSIVRATHLLPVFKVDTPITREVNFSHTPNTFTAFYINKHDYHAFETRGCAAAHPRTRNCQNPDGTPEVPSPPRFGQVNPYMVAGPNKWP